MAKRDKSKIDAAYAAITGAGKRSGQPSGKARATGVLLSAEELERVEAIAQDLGVTRHALLQHAIRDFIARYERGDRPKTQVKPVVTLKVE